jgi:thioredoxin 1
VASGTGSAVALNLPLIFEPRGAAFHQRFTTAGTAPAIPPPVAKLILETNAVSDQIVHVTDDTFETEVLNADQPVLVDYWAEWCGPCKMIAPILNEVADEYVGKIKVAKLNIDENPATPPKYGIRGIPTLMLFRNGNVEATKVGALTKSQLAAFIDSNM